MRLAFLGLSLVAASLLRAETLAAQESFSIDNKTASVRVEPFYSGSESRGGPFLGPQMPCTVYGSSKERVVAWIKTNVCPRDQFVTYSRVGPNISGGACGYAQFAAACISVR